MLKIQFPTAEGSPILRLQIIRDGTNVTADFLSNLFNYGFNPGGVENAQFCQMYDFAPKIMFRIFTPFENDWDNATVEFDTREPADQQTVNELLKTIPQELKRSGIIQHTEIAELSAEVASHLEETGRGTATASATPGSR